MKATSPVAVLGSGKGLFEKMQGLSVGGVIEVSGLIPALPERTKLTCLSVESKEWLFGMSWCDVNLGQLRITEKFGLMTATVEGVTA